MTKEGVRWWPEPIYMFATAVIIDLSTRQILFTKTKDRKQWVPGAGGEVIIPKDTSQPVFLQITAIRETAEELCVKGNEASDKLGLYIKLLGPCAFYLETLCGDSSHYKDAHGLYAYFLAYLANPDDKDKIRSKKQPDEEDCETEGIIWMTSEDFLAKIKEGKMETYPNIIRVLETLKWILDQQGNPFLKEWKPPRF